MVAHAHSSQLGCTMVISPYSVGSIGFPSVAAVSGQRAAGHQLLLMDTGPMVHSIENAMWKVGIQFNLAVICV